MQEGREEEQELNEARREAEAAFRGKKWQQCVECYRKLEQRQGGELDAWALFRRGTACSKLGDTSGALRDLDACLELRPEHTHACFARAMVFFSEGDFVRARKDLENTVRLDEDSGTPPAAFKLFYLGQCYFHLGGFADAVVAIEKAMERDD